MSAISAMASDSMTETQIENLLLAKDFSECVVYITDEGITVAVPAPADGLSRTRSEPSCKTHPRSDRSGDAAMFKKKLPIS